MSRLMAACRVAGTALLSLTLLPALMLGPAKAELTLRELNRWSSDLPSFYMQQRDFDRIEAAAVEVRDPRNAAQYRTPFAIKFYRAFWHGTDVSDPHAGDRHTTRFEAWTAAKPQSPTPYFIHAQKLLVEAQQLRGTASISEVQPENLQRATRLRAEARDFLLSNKARLDRDYAWYSMMFEAEVNLPLPRQETYARLAEGLRRYPDVLELYVTGAIYLQPKWGGSWEKFNAWITESVKETRAKHGLSVYTLTYMRVAIDPDFYLQPLLSKTHWERLKSGIFELDRVVATGSMDRDFLRLACAARDEIMIARSLDRIDSFQDYMKFVQAEHRKYLGTFAPAIMYESYLLDWVRTTPRPPSREICVWDRLDRHEYRTTLLPLPNIPAR